VPSFFSTILPQGKKGGEGGKEKKKKTGHPRLVYYSKHKNQSFDRREKSLERPGDYYFL
jgi:hypothetical protein